MPEQPFVQTVPISSLLPSDSPRLNGEDEAHIRRLVETEGLLPPILVHRESMKVIDGMHRLRAAVSAGHSEIEVTFFEGTCAEAFIRAVEANILHGLPLSLPDRRAAAARIILSHPKLSDRAIARRVGLSAKTISAMRPYSTADSPQSNDRVGADGRIRPLNSRDGRKLAAGVLASSPGASLREVAKIAGVSVSTAHDVRKRVLRGQSPVPAKYAGAGSAQNLAQAVPRPRQPGPAGPGRATRRGRSCRAIINALRKNPSLRDTQSGRVLLRWLNSHIVAQEDWSELLSSIPAHCIDPVIEIARQNAQSWHQFACELEPRRPR